MQTSESKKCITRTVQYLTVHRARFAPFHHTPVTPPTMTMGKNEWAAVFGASGVAMGAFGAHALKVTPISIHRPGGVHLPYPDYSVRGVRPMFRCTDVTALRMVLNASRL